MTRNQNRRVEIACPVEDPDLKQWLSHYLEVLLSDNVKARRLLPSGEYVDATQVDRPPLSSQEYFMEVPGLRTAETDLPGSVRQAVPPLICPITGLLQGGSLCYNEEKKSSLTDCTRRDRYEKSSVSFSCIRHFKC